MLPILPRELLWKDMHSMEEFIELDSVNNDFVEVFVNLHQEPFAVITDKIKVFNEVYYQLTRMMYERPMPVDLSAYVSDIKADLGWNYSAELVMSMAFHLLLLVDRKERPINNFFLQAVSERFSECIFWKPFQYRNETLKAEGVQLSYRFRPRPVAVRELREKYIHWNSITRDYDLLCIEEVITLWDNFPDRHEVAKMINESINHSTTQRSDTDLAHLRHFMEVNLMAENTAAAWECPESRMWGDHQILYEHIEELENEKRNLQGRIAELEAENEQLHTLLSNEKNNTGRDRRFTLPQIVNYCKGCVQWTDVHSIVAMLNKLLRRTATTEDEELIDSIEEEFLHRHHGNAYIQNNYHAPVGQVANYD